MEQFPLERSTPPREPERRSETIDPILTAALRLMPSYKRPDDAIWQAISSAGIQDRSARNARFRGIKIAIARMDKESRESRENEDSLDDILKQGAIEHERLIDPGETDAAQDRDN